MYSFPKLQPQGYALMSKSIIRVFIVTFSFLISSQVCSQNVGIGTLTPEDPLHLIGNMRISGGKIFFVNTGKSVFVGDSAGLADDLSDNKNVFVGHRAGQLNTTGTHNVAIGNVAMMASTTSNYNTAVGSESMRSGGLTGENNTAVGFETLKSNLSGQYNTALGVAGLKNNTLGGHNVALGTFSLQNNTTGSANVAIGSGNLIVSNGHYNTSVGFEAGYNKTSGDENVFLGGNAGRNNVTGSYNIFLGHAAGYNETGSNKLYIDNSGINTPLLYGEFDKNSLTINDTLITKSFRINTGKISFVNTGKSVFIGEDAGKLDDLTDNKNTLIGYQAGRSNITGTNNTAVGTNAFDNAVNSFWNIAIGTDALGGASTSGADLNTAIGNFSLDALTSGDNNTAIGQDVLTAATTGFENIGIGNSSLIANTTGFMNTAVGSNALGKVTTGTRNTAIGRYAGYNTTGSYNIFLGAEAGLNETGSYKLYVDVSNTSTPLLFGEFDSDRLTVNDELRTKRVYLTEGAVNGYLLKSDASGKGSWVNPTTLFNNVWSISGNDIYKNNTGNVGIGVTTPFDKLHVVGNLRIDGGKIPFYNTGQSIFIGEEAGLNDNLANNKNLFVGYHAGMANTTAQNNIALGAYALEANVDSWYNIAIGNNSLQNNGGNNNIGIGHGSLYTNTTGFKNIALGFDALNLNTTGTNNYAIGYKALYQNTAGFGNIAIGQEALLNMQTGGENVALGSYSGVSNNGYFNTFIGAGSGSNNVSGSGNIFLGSSAGANETGSNKLYISNSDTPTPLIYGEFDQKRLTINDTILTEGLYLTHGATDGYLLKSNASGKATWTDPNNFSIGPWSVSGNDIYKSNTGNVGIGVSNPLSLLHIDGNFRIDTGRIAMYNLGRAVFIGEDAGLNDDLLQERNNTHIGFKAGYTNTAGVNNTSLGSGALYQGNSPSENVAIGKQALFLNDGDYNVSVGAQSGVFSTGSNNTFLGYGAGATNTGDGNVFIGKDAGAQAAGSNKLFIDNSLISTPLIYGEFDQNRLTINDTLLTERLYITEGATDGYLLKSNASGKAIWTDPASIFNNVWSISGNNIYKNNTGNVGVGVTSPLDKLHVVGNLRVDGGKIPFYNTGKSVYIGEEAGLNDQLIDNKNLFVGYHAGKGNTTAQNNIALGAYALEANVGGWWNIGIGNNTLAQNNGGSENIAIGHGTLNANTTGFKNIALGIDALKLNTTGTNNYAIGYKALHQSTTGFGNIAIGQEALKNLQTGGENVAIGSFTGTNNNGFGNTFVGAGSGTANINGSGNVFLGSSAGGNETGSNKLYIANSNTSNPLVYGEFEKNRLTVNDTLLTERIYLTEGAGNGYLLKSSASGRASWVNPTTLFNNVWSISGNDIYKNNSGNVGIGTAVPTSTFEVNGAVGVNFKNAQIVGTNDPDDSAMIWRYTSNIGGGVITLPTASSCKNRIYTIMNFVGDIQTISTYTDLTGSASGAMDDMEIITIASDGTGWFQIK